VTTSGISDHEQIRQLAYRYAEAVDSRDLDTLVTLFVPDVQVGRDARGRDALATWFDPVLRTFGVSIHFVGNHRITLDDDEHASGSVYCRAEHEVDGRWIVMTVIYGDTYERRDGEWLFARRKERVFYGADATTSPAGPLRDRWPGREDKPADLPESWPSWQRFWA